MRTDDMERGIKRAVESRTPDVLEGVLARWDGRGTDAVFIPLSARPAFRWARSMGALAAALLLAFGGWFAAGGFGGRHADTWVMLDVNPSVTLVIDRDARVMEARGLNSDGIRVLDRMDLRGTPVDVAVNALIGSMLKFGYIQENANSVLLSVEGVNAERSAALRRDLAESISLQLNVLNGAVISQQLSGDEETRQLAQSFQISDGKAALIQSILADNSHLMFADLAALSVNELNLLAGSKRVEAEGVTFSGSASDTDYIGAERAAQTALNHAGTDGAEAGDLRIELDLDDGRMVYDVEFYLGGYEYELEIDAVNGAVLQYDRERESRRARPEPTEPARAPSGREAFIGEERALSIAQQHAGVTADADAKLDKDDGRYVYEIEFQESGEAYDYEIDAVTGDILSWDREED